MMLKLFCTVWVVTFLAELPDKTAFASFVLSSRKKPLAVFAGGAAAMVVHSAIAVWLGNLLGMLPAMPLRIASGSAFLVFAFLIWRRKGEQEEGDHDVKANLESFWATALGAFAVIFVAEWGDLTQFSTAALAAKFRCPWPVFGGAVAGLWCAIGLAGWLGKKMGSAFSQKTLQRLAAGVFLAVGLWILI